MMEPNDIRRVLFTALIYSFEAHGYAHDEARILAGIAVEPCSATIALAQRVIQLNLEAAAIFLHDSAAQKEKPP